MLKIIIIIKTTKQWSHFLKCIIKNGLNILTWAIHISINKYTVPVKKIYLYTHGLEMDRINQLVCSHR